MPIHGEQGEMEERGSHSRWVGGQGNKQTNLHMRLVLGSSKMSRSLHPPARICKVYAEALAGFSHISSPDGVDNTLLSQGCVLGTALIVGTVGWMRTFQGWSRGEESRAARVNLQSCPLHDLLQHYCFSLRSSKEQSLKEGFNLESDSKEVEGEEKWIRGVRAT